MFSLEFRTVASPSAALGANVLGAVAGGLLENVSLMVGIPGRTNMPAKSTGTAKIAAIRVPARAGEPETRTKGNQYTSSIAASNAASIQYLEGSFRLCSTTRLAARIAPSSEEMTIPFTCQVVPK